MKSRGDSRSLLGRDEGKAVDFRISRNFSSSNSIPDGVARRLERHCYWSAFLRASARMCWDTGDQGVTGVLRCATSSFFSQGSAVLYSGYAVLWTRLGRMGWSHLTH